MPCEVPTDFIVVQTSVSSGTSYTVPSGDWTITSWSAARGTADLGGGQTVIGGREALVIFRPTGNPHEYKIVGSTSAQSLDSPLNTFKTKIKVKGGDLLGLWVQAESVCARFTNSPGDTIEALFPSGIPSAGTTVMTLFPDPGPVPGIRLNVSVTLDKESGGSGSGAPPPPLPEPARIAICTAKPIQRTDGTLGTFADVLASEYPTTDPASPYYGAAPAKYAQGIGLTCDNLPGYTDAGYKVNGDGVRAPAGLEASWPAPYEYYTNTA